MSSTARLSPKAWTRKIPMSWPVAGLDLARWELALMRVECGQ